MTSPLSRWLASHAPALLDSLGAPLADAALAKTEALLGRSLPSDYVSFLRAHDGQRFVLGDRPGIGSLAPIIRAFEILPLGYAAGEWRSMREWDEGPGEVDGPVRPLFVHEAWWPFTVIYGSSHHHCIDLDPAPGGDVGQIIVVSMKDDRRTVIAPSFEAFIERLIALLDEPATEVGEDGIELADDALDWLMGS